MQNQSIGMAKPPKGHQRLIWDLLVMLNNEIDSDYIALPEPNLVDSDQYSKQPDVLVIDEEEEINILPIEIEQKAGIKETIKKVQAYLQSLELPEAFVIQYKPVGYSEYEIQKWYRITQTKIIENESFSEVLDFDLDNL